MNRPIVLMYKSVNGQVRVIYRRDSLGDKYFIQYKDYEGDWRYLYSTNSPVEAEEYMRKSAGEYFTPVRYGRG